MKNHLKNLHGRGTSTRRELHIHASQQARSRYGAGIASVDIHAWLLSAALAFLLRDDPYGSWPLQILAPTSSQSIVMPAYGPASTFSLRDVTFLVRSAYAYPLPGL